MQTSKKILVTGGAGYIGSHVVKQLGRETDYEIVVYDNLSTGSPKAVLYGELVVGDLADLQKLAQVFAEHQFDAVLHFAASISVPESTANPLAYYGNNTRNTLNLLQCCETYGVKKLVFLVPPQFMEKPPKTRCGNQPRQHPSIPTVTPN